MMPISSLLLDVASGEESAVVELLQALESLEVHQVRQGQIIVVTDTRSLEADRLSPLRWTLCQAW